MHQSAMVPDAMHDLMGDDEDTLIEIVLEEGIGIEQKVRTVSCGDWHVTREHSNVLRVRVVQHGVEDMGECGLVPKQCNTGITPQFFLPCVQLNRRWLAPHRDSRQLGGLGLRDRDRCH